MIPRIWPRIQKTGAIARSQSRSQSGAIPLAGWLRLSFSLVILWASGGAIATGIHLGTAQSMERWAQTLFFRLRGTVAPESVVILAMDQESLARGEEVAEFPEFAPLQTFPWSRLAYAQVIERLMQAGARAIALDVLLIDPRLDAPDGDAALSAVLAQYGDRIVLASQYEAFGTPETGEMGQLLTPDPAFQAAPPYHLINFWPAPDQRVYELPETFIERVLEPQGMATDTQSLAVGVLRAAQHPLPPRLTGNIYFYGPPTTFPRIPFWHGLSADNWRYHQEQQTFRDKIVLIGPIAGYFQDFVGTPFSDNMPGVELHANVVATLMAGNVMRDGVPSPIGRAALLGVGTVAIAMLLLRGLKRPVPLFLGFVGGAIAWGGVGYLSFTYGHVIFPVAIPVGVLLLSGISSLAVGAIANQQEQRRLRQTLERYVAAPVVQEILTHHSADFQSLLKGRRVQAAVLFCDIRSFTSFSMTVEPEQLVEQLNSYLNAMVEAILEAGGTVDKFIGDAIMAEFGSPISQGIAVDTLNAIRAALGMRAALLRLQQEWAAAGQPILFNGIGINFGEAIAGDIGSIRRREYALIGDAVNIASRVEGLTRNLLTDILITESLYDQVREAVEVVPMGQHEMKGRGQNKVMLYSLVGLKETPNTSYHQIHQKLHQCYGLKLPES